MAITMTTERRAERVSDMATARQLAIDKVAEYNDAMDHEDLAKMVKLEGEIDAAVKEHNNISYEIAMADCGAAEDPMLAILKQLLYPTIRAKDEKVPNTEIKIRVIEDSTKRLDPLDLHKRIKGGVGADKNWPYMIEKFNYLMTIMAIEKMETKDKEEAIKRLPKTYNMNELSRQYNFGEFGKNGKSTKIVSKNDINKALTKVVQAMVGPNYKPLTHDVNYLMGVYIKEDTRSKHGFVVPNHNTFRRMISTVASRIVTEGYYTAGGIVEKDPSKAKAK